MAEKVSYFTKKWYFLENGTTECKIIVIYEISTVDLPVLQYQCSCHKNTVDRCNEYVIRLILFHILVYWSELKRTQNSD